MNTETSQPSLQLLYPGPLELDVESIRAVLRDYHPSLQDASVELQPAPVGGGTQLSDAPPVAMTGQIAWDSHRIQLIACDSPMPYGPLETSVFPAMMAPETKAEAKQHRSHVMLYYGGESTDAREQYVALGAVAGSLARFSAIVIVNEEARTSVPAFELIRDEDESDMLAVLRGFPIPYLWGGFVKLDTGDANRPWVRTFTNHRFGLPNFAAHLRGHHETSATFMQFAGILAYLEEQQTVIEPGDELDLGDGNRLVIRAPSDAEWWLDSPGVMYVIQRLES